MKKIFSVLALGVAILATNMAWGRGASSTVSITLRVEKFAEWADVSPVIVETDWPAINKVNQTRIVSKSVVLYTNADTVVTARAGLNGGVLSNGDQTLKTAYKITGSVANPDGAFKDSSTFFSGSNTYTVVHEHGVGAYTINLQVQATSPEGAAPDEGLYTCGVILTAAW